MMRPRITAVRPLWAIEGGRVTIHGEGFSPPDPLPPDVRLDQHAAHVDMASSTAVSFVVPDGLDGGRVPVRVGSIPGETAFLQVGRLLATGIHQVDNPAIDDAGHVYVTYSGTRGLQVPVSVFRVSPDGVRVPFVEGITNATALAFDGRGTLHVSSRFDGVVYRVSEEGTPEAVATDLGVACGLAFAADGTLFVGDRSGTIFRVSAAGAAEPFATLPPSVAAFHLAAGADGFLYVTAPTLAAHDVVYRVSIDGDVEVAFEGFGRPQGLAFSPEGVLHVVEALAGASGVYAVRPGRRPELVGSGRGLVGLAFDPRGGLVLASNDAVYRVDRAPSAFAM